MLLQVDNAKALFYYIQICIHCLSFQVPSKLFISFFSTVFFEVPGLSNYATAVVQRKRLNEISILDLLSNCGNFILTSRLLNLVQATVLSAFHFQIIARLM